MAESNFADPELLERLKKRDGRAWESMVDLYLPQLLRAGRGMGFSGDESRDLAQSVFVALMEGIDRFEGRSQLRTFLFEIFYNKVSERLREKQEGGKERSDRRGHGVQVRPQREVAATSFGY